MDDRIDLDADDLCYNNNMSRSNRRVFQLARLSQRPESEVIAVVRAAGIDVISSNSLVPLSKVDAIEKLLGINRWQFRLHVREQTQHPPPLDLPTEVVAAEPERKPRLPKWETVGHPTNEMILLAADEVERIHWLLVDDFRKSKDPIDPPGVKSKDLLESAVHRMRTSLGEQSKYPTVPMTAAALLHAVTCNHAFHNGNKRTALVATLVFLDRNGYLLEVDQDELFDYMLRVAAHTVIDVTINEAQSDREMIEISRWIHRNSRPISNAEKPLQFRDLKAILRQYDCTFDHPQKGNRINIHRYGWTTQVYYRNEGTDVDRNTIRKVRQDLGLTDAEGYDSAIFYDAAERVPDFILKYRRTLDRLAKV